jgi:hypothetical protein
MKHAEEPFKVDVASHEGPHSESLGEPPPEVGDLAAERVEERSVERYAGILGQGQPQTTEDDKEVDASSTPSPSLQVTGGLALSDSE